MLKALIRIGKPIGHWVDSISDFALVLSGIASLVAVVMVSAEVVIRYGQLARFTFADEYSGYLLVFITFLAASNAIRTGTFVRLGFITQLLSKQVKEILNVIAYALGFIVVGFYLWQSYGLFAQSLELQATSIFASNTPLAIPQSFILVGLVMVELTLAVLIIKTCFNLVTNHGGKLGD